MKMLGQLQESQQKIQNAKEAMKNEFLDEKSSDNLLEVKVSKAGRVKEIKIDDELLEDKEQLVDYLILTLNKALERTQNQYDAELERVARQGMPQIPGMPF
ncbi:YbaB/EbfC family nucleoid-associated protein [Ornithobacterium rhinotracheale]|uniref:YbaB/EbfC family nucleoid-associated protein n=1 Tax=Ornithobacterium rhinotracheale TaxID=28251 RepID=UPI001FF6CB19|nr:YbaB/EbfC family nucleoid-associated protein [Ornithobacterium rhinotracheale]MCK0201449.1 YbaB/EbfC family nucleoid-associated protein [Ornithobacterium rhinotracheale]